MGGGGSQLAALYQVAATATRREGIAALYTGLNAAVLRQVVYGGIGLGAYAPIRRVILGIRPGTSEAEEKAIVSAAPMWYVLLIVHL